MIVTNWLIKNCFEEGIKKRLQLCIYHGTRDLTTKVCKKIQNYIDLCVYDKMFYLHSFHKKRGNRHIYHKKRGLLRSYIFLNWFVLWDEWRAKQTIHWVILFAIYTRMYDEKLLFNRQTKCHTGMLACHLETEHLYNVLSLNCWNWCQPQGPIVSCIGLWTSSSHII